MWPTDNSGHAWLPHASYIHKLLPGQCACRKPGHASVHIVTHRVVRGSGRVDPRVGSGRVGSGHGNWLQPWVGSGPIFMRVYFCHVAVFWSHIQNGGRQLHNYTGWLVTKGCLLTILKCEETLCVEQLDTVVYSHIRRRHDTDSIWCAHIIVLAIRIIRLVARVTLYDLFGQHPSALCELFCAIGK